MATIMNRKAALLALVTSLWSCSEAENPGPEPSQGTAGAAWVPESGSSHDQTSPDELPTKEEICVEGSPGGLPLKDCSCSGRTCGEVCDPCMGCLGQPEPGCNVDGGIHRCSWQRICTATSD